MKKIVKHALTSGRLTCEFRDGVTLTAEGERIEGGFWIYADTISCTESGKENKEQRIKEMIEELEHEQPGFKLVVD